jgi:LPS export ABC transporter protein LptC
MVSPRNIRLVLALLVIAASAGIVAAIFLKGPRAPLKEPVSRQMPRNIDVALSKARFTEVRDGVTAWELVADRAEYDKTGELAQLTDIRMVYAKSRTNGSITLTAAAGEYAATSRNIRLRGSVHAESESGMSFDTESLDYLAAQGLFRTSDHVAFRHERLTLAARGMELDARSETTRFRAPVDAVVTGLKPR